MLVPDLAALDHLGPWDRLYLSPHLDDAVLSCGASLVAERAAGLSILVATLFTEGPGHDVRRGEDAAALDPRGIHRLHARLADAPWRSPCYGSFSGIVHGRDPADDACSAELLAWLTEVVERARPAAVVAPLGVGTHVDHRLSFEAAVALSRGGTTFYEDIPYALAEGAAALRLLEIGAVVSGGVTLPGRDVILESHRSLPHVRRYRTPAEAASSEQALLSPLDEPPAARFRATSSTTAHGAAVLREQLAMVACHASQLEEMLGGIGALERALGERAAILAPGAAVAERRWRLARLETEDP